MAVTNLSKGTTLKVKLGSGTWTKVNGFKDFSGLGGGAAQVIETTDLDSTAKEKRLGLPDEGNVKYSFNFIAGDAGQKMLEDARSNGSLLSFQITIPDAAVIYTHDGYVQTAEKTGGVDKLIDLSVGVEITGAAVRSAVTA